MHFLIIHNIMASEKRKHLDAASLKLSYQRKTSEYLLRMSSLNLDDQTMSQSSHGDSNCFLRTMGQSMISRLCSQPISGNPVISDVGNNKSNTSRRVLCLKTITSSQDSMFNYFRESIMTGTDDNKRDRNIGMDSYYQIRDHVDQLIQLNDNCTGPILWNTIDSVCPSCGSPFLLCPTKDGVHTTIRLRRVKRGKARQRRSLRYRKKQAIVDQQMMKHRGGGKQFAAVQLIQNADEGLVSHGSLIAGVTTEKMDRIKQHLIRRVRDGQAAQKVVYTCGSCHERSSYKGASVLKRKTRRIHRRELISGNNKGMANVANLVTANAPKPAKVLSNEVATSRAPEIPHNPLKKRKKEHLNPPKHAVSRGNSSLMDFLSSLND